MTMLIAGHETTAAVLTWSIFLLAQVSINLTFGFSFDIPNILCFSLFHVMQNPSKMRKAQAEVDSVLGEERITLESVRKLE